MFCPIAYPGAQHVWVHNTVKNPLQELAVMDKIPSTSTRELLHAHSVMGLIFAGVSEPRHWLTDLPQAEMHTAVSKFRVTGLVFLHFDRLPDQLASLQGCFFATLNDSFNLSIL